MYYIPKFIDMYPRLFAYAFVRLRRPKAPLREPFLPLLAPQDAALPCGGGSSLQTR